MNNETNDDLKHHLRKCCGAERWVTQMAKAWSDLPDPQDDPAAVFGTADRIWWSLNESDWREAFTHHPQIGADMSKLREKYGPSGALSVGEQAGVVGAAEDVLTALAAGNIAYEEKFGYIFIVCASGKSATEMLDLLRERLVHQPAEELRIAADEQRKITRLRLENWLGITRPLVWQGTLAALQNEKGQIAMQLRDDKERIAYPNSWGLFGGGMESGETSRETAVREVGEELGIEIEPHRMRFGLAWYDGEAHKLYNLFTCLITKDTLSAARLTEGQRWAWIDIRAALSGRVQGHEIAANHKWLLRWSVERGLL